MYLYNLSDVILLGVIVDERLYTLRRLKRYDPKNFASTSGFSSAALAKYSRHVITFAPNYQMLMAFEKAVRGGFSSVSQRLAFDSAILPGDKLVSLLDTSTTLVISSLFYCKTMKMDENNQYGMSMTKKMPYGGMKLIVPVPTVDQVLDMVKTYVSEESDIGYLLCVDLNPPTDVLNIALCEAFVPIFERVELDVKDMSTLFLETHTVTSKSGKPNKIRPTLKTHCTLRKRVEQYVHIETLKYVIEQLGWQVTVVHSIISYRQSNWMAGYVTDTPAGS